MTKVLGKALTILEAVAVAAPDPVPLRELVSRLGLNKATCSRLALELVEAGYLEQHSRLSGFRIGPKIWAIGSKTSYAEDLIAAADAPVRACAEELQQSIMLVILRGGRRYVLIHHNGNPSHYIDLKQLAYPDAFNTATGIVLLAYSDETEYQAALAIRTDEYSFRWQERGGDACRDAILKQIRDEGVLIHESTSSIYPSAVACPVFRDGQLTAAVGVSIPRDEFIVPGERERFVSRLKLLAQQVSGRLSSRQVL